MTKIEYLLVCLAEECAEVTQEATKALRFGLYDSWRDRPETSECITHEFHDVLTVYQMLDQMGIFPKVDSQMLIDSKRHKLLKYMEYARGRGTLDKENADEIIMYADGAGVVTTQRCTTCNNDLLFTKFNISSSTCDECSKAFIRRIAERLKGGTYLVSREMEKKEGTFILSMLDYLEKMETK